MKPVSTGGSDTAPGPVGRRGERDRHAARAQRLNQSARRRESDRNNQARPAATAYGSQLAPLRHADTRAASAARDCRASSRPRWLPCAAAKSGHDATGRVGGSEHGNDHQNGPDKSAPAPPRLRRSPTSLLPFHAVRGTTEQPHDQRADLQHERNIQRKLPEQRCGGSRAPVCTGRRLASKHSFELFLQLPDLRVRGACRSGRSQSHGSLQSVRYGRSVCRCGRPDARQCRSGGTKVVEALRRPAPGQGVIDAQDRACAGCGSDQPVCAKAWDRSIPQDIAQEAPPAAAETVPNATSSSTPRPVPQLSFATKPARRPRLSQAMMDTARLHESGASPPRPAPLVAGGQEMRTRPRRAVATWSVV